MIKRLFGLDTELQVWDNTNSPFDGAMREDNIRRATLEEAAELVESIDKEVTASEVAAAIRALKP